MTTATTTATAPSTGYAPVNGLEMYYEIHGEGEPLLLLHGAYMTAGDFGPLLPALAENRRVIVPEFQAHGRTADIDRPLTYEGMADDVAGLMRHLGIERADVVGYSMGGGAGLQLAIRHPQLVRKLVAASVSYAYEGMHDVLIEMFPTMTIEMFAGSPMEEAYRRVAPRPEDFPTLFAKLKQLDTTPFNWAEGIRGITAPVLYVLGDSDAIRLEHAVELFRLLGGGVMGDMGTMPNAQLAVLPGTTHYMGAGLLTRVEWLRSMIAEFLAAPMPEAEQSAAETTPISAQPGAPGV